MMKFAGSGVLSALLICSILPVQPVAAAGRLVAFRAADGHSATGLLMEASQRPAPAVVLVPMLGASKDELQAVGQRLAEANITALAIDLPGSSVPGEAGALAAWNGDVRAALDYLASRPEVRATALGVAGASLGANLAAVVAGSDPRVRSLALVSPTLDYRGVRIEQAMRQYGARPALLMASLKDSYSARSIRDLTKDPPGTREVRWSEASAHGLVLLAREPDLVRALVEWFQRTL